MSTPLTAQQIAEWIGGEVAGDPATPLAGFAPFEAAEAAHLTFAADNKRLSALATCKAGVVIVPAEADVTAETTLIRVADVQRAIVDLLDRFAPPPDVPAPGVHPSAVIDSTAQIAESAAVGPNVVVGANSRIGAGSALCANVTVGRDVQIGADCVVLAGTVIETRSVLGDRVRIGPNSVIGHEGFGYLPSEAGHRRIEHIGNVVIDDDVDIGACACVDRAKFGSTRICRGVKIDNLVQVAHNAHVGEGTLLAALSGVAGSTKVGRGVVFGGHVGVRDNITIGDGVQIAAFSAASNDVEAGKIVAGIPARDGRLWRRMMTSLMKLPDLLKRVRELEKKVLEQS